jgi:hypothetical protein
MLKLNPELLIPEIGTLNYLFPVYPGPCNYFPRHKNYVPNGKISTVTDIYGPPVIFIFNLFSPQSLSLIWLLSPSKFSSTDCSPDAPRLLLYGRR